jgi:putative membrane protein
MKWILSLLSNWLVLMLAAMLFADGFYIESIGIALLSAVIFTIVNGIVRPILIFLTMPITELTLGLFLLVINAVTLLITAALVNGFEIDGFGTAILAGIVISVLVRRSDI